MARQPIDVTSLIYEHNGFEYRPMIPNGQHDTRARDLAMQGMENVRIVRERVTGTRREVIEQITYFRAVLFEDGTGIVGTSQ
jgi:hypothetical protein